MLVVKANTKKGIELLEKVKNYDGYYLHDVYGNCSHQKYQAWQDCYKQCCLENGENFHICSHNRYYFSVAWRTEDGNYKIKTGQTTYLITF